MHQCSIKQFSIYSIIWMMLSLMSLKSVRIYVQKKGGRKETQQMLSNPLRQYRGLVSDVRDLTAPPLQSPPLQSPPPSHTHILLVMQWERWPRSGEWQLVRGPAWWKGREPLFKVLRQVFIRVTAPYCSSLCDRHCHMLFYLLFATRNAFINRYQNRGF